MMVFFRGETGAVTTVVTLDHVVRNFAKTVAKRVTLREATEPQPNQPIKSPERVSVRPATVVAKSDISSEIAPRQQQLATLEES